MENPRLNLDILRVKFSRFQIVLLGAVSIVIALFSWFFSGDDFGITENNPGGKPLEIAFWLSAVSCAGMAFAMLEQLFRSRETQILAPLPVAPEVLFSHHLKKIFSIIALSTFPFAAAFLPLIPKIPAPATLCILLWPTALACCAVVSAAVVLYFGNNAAKEHAISQSSAMTFSMAPAVALGISLLLCLVLKLLAEALLKPDFFNAAMTAAGIAITVSAACALYARRLYIRHYYAILAFFMDADRIVIDANYDFIGNRDAQKLLRATSPTAALKIALVEQFKRRHPMSGIIVIVLGVLFALASMRAAAPPPVAMPPFAAACALVFLAPWRAFSNHETGTVLIAHLPIPYAEITRARMMATFQILVVPVLFLSIGVACSTAAFRTIPQAAATAAATFAAVFLAAWTLEKFTQKFPTYSAYATFAMAGMLAILSLML